ncbi:MAG TPA: HEAT repeat domain-containing protein [Gemmataceae bacterium]|nr:HEAT repeat domain-containing protein [Gemmataceae bacterium]
MARCTRRVSRNPWSGRAAALLAMLTALTAVVWAVPGAVRAQQPTPSTPPAAQPQQAEPQQPQPPPKEGAAATEPPAPTPPPSQSPVSNLVPGGFSGPGSGFSGPGPFIFNGPGGGPQAPAMRFQATIDPKTPVKDLLPTPPKAKTPARRGPADDLASVPEVAFQAAFARDLQTADVGQRTAQMLAGINFLNGKKTDGFLLALRGERADLDGLPFAMGDACRTRGERNRQFTTAVQTVRQALQNGAAQPDPNTGQPAGEREQAGNFWVQFTALCDQQDRGASQIDREHREAVVLARVAALMQILAPETPDLRLGLVRYLSGVPYVDATRALARMAIFSAEDEVRQAAVDALQVRRERDYTDVLVKGLHYPWPAVARRAAEASAKLGRTDLEPELIALLDEPDPRAPTTQQSADKPALVVRELVRVNHNRNCIMCHSPGNTDGVSADTLRAPIPLPTEPLTPSFNGYQSSTPDLAVRLDVTYLRQDFSQMQPVEDAAPWPEMQRFDFLVRERAVTADEAAEVRAKLDKREPGQPSPYQAAALVALRELTGKDAAPTAEAWRRVLNVSSR